MNVWRGSVAVLVSVLAACGDSSGSGGGGSNEGGGGSNQGGGGSNEGGGGSNQGGGGSNEGGFGPVRLGVNDVSVLFPIPQSVPEELISIFAQGNGGPLLSQADFDAHFELLQDRVDYETLRIVGARIDPCFPDLALLDTNPSACRPQLRLVAQPVYVGANDNDPTELAVADQALHLLYDLPQSEFDTLLADWAELHAGDADASEPLGVNPRLLDEGLSGPYATALRGLILEHAGPLTLGQVTFTRGNFSAWTFGGFRVENGVFTPLTIPGLTPNAENEDATKQIFFTDAGLAPYEFIGMSAETQTLMALSGELENPGKIGGNLVLTASQAEIDAAIQLTYDIDHPAKFNPDTLDCSSCHMAGHARERAKTLGQSIEGFDEYESATLTTAWDPSDNLFEQRNFGWLIRKPTFSKRTVNESAAVAERLNAILGAL